MVQMVLMLRYDRLDQTGQTDQDCQPWSRVSSMAKSSINTQWLCYSEQTRSHPHQTRCGFPALGEGESLSCRNGDILFHHQRVRVSV